MSLRRGRAVVGGCGLGEQCWALAALGWRCTGVDLICPLIDAARGLADAARRAPTCGRAMVSRPVAFLPMFKADLG